MSFLNNTEHMVHKYMFVILQQLHVHQQKTIAKIVRIVYNIEKCNKFLCFNFLQRSVQ